jgi:hypothetical protein
VLDEAFPGSAAGGITSNFQGLLEQVLGDMLNGRAPSARRQTVLPKLVLTDDDFGREDPRCSAYYVVRLADGWVLNWAGTQFVEPPRVQDNVDAWVSHEAAVSEVVKCIAAGLCAFHEVKVVGVTEAAFKTHGVLASTPTNRLSS